MRSGLFLVVSSQALLLINCQTLGDKLTPLVKLTRLFMSDLVRPRTFEVGYRVSRKNDVRGRRGLSLNVVGKTFSTVAESPARVHGPVILL